MFGIIKVGNENNITGAFANMNSTDHHFKQETCHPILESSESIAFVKNTRFHLNNKKFMLFFEGKLNNRSELADQLNLINSSHTEAEVLIAAYQKWDDDFICKIEGEYSILIYNKAKKEIKLYRDPIGIMPIYYVQNNEGFFFSSELRRLYAIKEFTTIDWTYLKYVLSNNIPQNYDKTWFESIKRLPPGHKLSYTSSKIDVQKYERRQIENYTGQDDIESVLEKFRFHLETAVLRQVSDVASIHSHFSGGLDSTGISAIAWEYAKTKNIKFNNYACGLKDEQINNPYKIKDDREMLASITHASGLPKPEIVGASDAVSMEELYQPQVLPKHHDTETYLSETLEKIASEEGKILLSGFGGDECVTYNQYPFYLSTALRRGRLFKFYKEAKAFGFKISLFYILTSIPIINKLIKKLKPNLVLPNTGKKNKWKKKLIKSPMQENFLKKIDRLELNDDLLTLLQSPHISYRIEKEKEFASYYGIEIRYPLLDFQLVSFFMGLPSKFKLYEGKGRKLYRLAIQKWVDYDPFLKSGKSSVATVPIQRLRMHKAIEEKLLDYDEIIKRIPAKLLPHINILPKPKDHELRKDQYYYRSYLLLAEVSNFVSNYE